MKIILSHDVDHITVWEHALKDTVLPKFIIRSQIEFFCGKISITEYLNRVADFFRNKWNGVDEIMAFHESKNIKSTFFVGVNNGVGLSYSLAKSAATIQRIVSKNFEAGVHGINFDTKEGMQAEFDLFKQFSGKETFGIRMHYLRMNENTLDYIQQAGYSYDATKSGIANPYFKNELLEFPLQLMDGWAIEGDRRFQSRNLMGAKDYTMKKIDESVAANLSYMSILFHDRYFSNSFKTWMEWYVWLVEYLEKNNFTFIDHQTAAAEIKIK